MIPYVKTAMKHLMVLLGCVHMTCGPQGALQAVAWVSMLANYSLENGVAQGVVDTFSGERPCAMCLMIADTDFDGNGSSEAPSPERRGFSQSLPQEWQTARAMARHRGIGDIGPSPGVDVAVDLETTSSDPILLYAVLEICRSSDHPDYLALAERIGDNIIAQRFHKGFFLPSSGHVNARVGAVEPLALLALEAVLRGEPQAVPGRGGMGFFHGPHDSRGRTTDGSVLWNARR